MKQINYNTNRNNSEFNFYKIDMIWNNCTAMKYIKNVPKPIAVHHYTTLQWQQAWLNDVTFSRTRQPFVPW